MLVERRPPVSTQYGQHSAATGRQLSSRNGPPLESPIPRNFAAGSHAGWPPTWRSLVSNAIPLPGPVLMLTVPAATFLLVLLLVTFSNSPSLQMMSAFLHRRAQMPPISHLLSTSHPPLATKAESAKSSRPNKQLLPAPSSSAATSTLFQIGLPLFPREDSLAEALELPPLSMEQNFYMPGSAIGGLFSQLLTVPLYRQPNTLGWPYKRSPPVPARVCSGSPVKICKHARPRRGKNSEAGVTPLLRFVFDSKPTGLKKRAELGIVTAEIPKN